MTRAARRKGGARRDPSSRELQSRRWGKRGRNSSVTWAVQMEPGAENRGRRGAELKREGEGKRSREKKRSDGTRASRGRSSKAKHDI